MLDSMITTLDHALKTLGGAGTAARPYPRPAQGGEAPVLTAAERRDAGALMRVNHVGEVCAQAMYQAQALTARTPAMRSAMQEASREEGDHLAWTRQRLDELGARPSLLNPLWYAGAFSFGLIAGRVGDAASLGFVVETERQVEQHLQGHLDRLPPGDLASRAIVEQMKADENHHAETAKAAGARTVPWPVRMAMRAAAKVMTRTAHHL